MQLSFSIPDDTLGLERVKSLADSLLATRVSSIDQPWSLAALAALTGRAELAYELAVDPASGRRLLGSATPSLGASAPALLALAAIGGPVDSLASLEQRVRQSIELNLTATASTSALRQWLVRPATLAFPHHRFAAFEQLAVDGDYLWDIQLALLRGDTAAALDGIAAIEGVRRQLLPSTIAIDGAYPEAYVIAELGRTELAIRWLDLVFEALPQSAPRALSTPERAASVVRAAELRAELADAAGDRRSAGAWSRAVTILWRDADPFLQPSVAAMAALAN
jgi:hypothetical protein